MSICSRASRLQVVSFFSFISKKTAGNSDKTDEGVPKRNISGGRYMMVTILEWSHKV